MSRENLGTLGSVQPISRFLRKLFASAFWTLRNSHPRTGLLPVAFSILHTAPVFSPRSDTARMVSRNVFLVRNEFRNRSYDSFERFGVCKFTAFRATREG